MQRQVIIVGSGFSGIAMAVLLKKAGIEHFTILEKAKDIGGTWRDNTYPGAACDIPSHLYSFSFEPKPDWSYTFSPQAEIHAYLQHCIDKYDLKRHILFDREVSGGSFDERSATWTVETKRGERFEARALVLGNGALHIPSYPEIEGLQDFGGKLFHSARWDHDYDLRDKRVAVIGTGASAIQFVPEIAPDPSKLSVFQRTPPWVIPKGHRPMRAWEKKLFSMLPPLHKAYRAWLYWTHEVRAFAFVRRPKAMRLVEGLARKYLASVVPDPELRRKLTPQYAMGCKRILLSNDYYQTLQRDNVELVTDSIQRVTRDGIVTHDGVTHPADAIICGTGFGVSDYLSPIALRGRDGRSLNDTLQQDRGSYLGISIHGFPNMFLMTGPNTGLGHNSMVFMIEAQARYAAQGIQRILRDGVGAMDVRADVQSQFTAEIQRRLDGTVWHTGCSSWYLKDGYNMTLWPGFTVEYWRRTRRLAMSAYAVTPLQEDAATTRHAPAYRRPRTPATSVARAQL